ncbi:MAG: DUF371 domain-containing protein [Sulfolobales archaeon]
MIFVDSFRARGHSNITARHKTTLEITKESYVTKKGDCIIAIESEKSVKDLRSEIKESIKRGWFISLVIKAGNLVDYVMGLGDPRLSLEDPIRIVVRKSNYIDQKTLMIKANKAASDLNRDLVKNLRISDTSIDIIIATSDDINELIEYINSEFI